MNKQSLIQGCNVEHRQSLKEYDSHPPSLKILQDQAIYHRICAEVMSSSPNHRLVLAPQHSGSVRTKRQQVLEILDGALCIVEAPDMYTELYYEVPTKK
jgi:hypothetical protein